jgi:UDP-N-acetylmuramoylalanine--D-glutamate ligase
MSRSSYSSHLKEYLIGKTEDSLNTQNKKSKLHPCCANSFLEAKEFFYSENSSFSKQASELFSKLERIKKDGFCPSIQDLALGGKHNIYNSMAAALAAKAMDIDNAVIRDGLATFQAVEHRLEKVLSIRDVLYVNDSKATNVDAAWYALECQTRPVIWIAGGTDKGNDYSTLVPLAKEKVKALICMGVDNAKLHEAFDAHVENTYDVTSAEEAVKIADSIASAGDVVLLSPCCASFDLFKNYEDRGRKFKEAVRNL